MIGEVTLKLTDVRDSVRLISIHATSNKKPGRDVDYMALVSRCLNDRPFRELVMSVADGMGAVIADIHETDGVTLSIKGGSPLATRWSDILKSLDGTSGESVADRRAVTLACIIGVAATFFPTADSQFNDELQRPSLKVDDCIANLRKMKNAFKEENGIADTWPDHWNVMARALDVIPEKRPNVVDRSLSSIEAQVKKYLRLLEDQGLVAKRPAADGRDLYVANRRYRIQISAATNDSVLRISQALLASADHQSEEA